MAANLRHVSLAFEHWFLYILILESEMKKKVLKFGSEIFRERKSYVASAYLDNRHLPQSKPGPFVVPTG